MRGGWKNIVSKEHQDAATLFFFHRKGKHPDNYSDLDPMEDASPDPSSQVMYVGHVCSSI